MDVLTNATGHVVNRPVQSTKLVIFIIALVFPGWLVGPILGALGFTSTGVAAGSAAAYVHSFTNPIAAYGIFATMQSAAAGGYGVASVNTVFQVVTALGVAASRCFR